MAKDFNSSKVVNTYNEHIRKLIPGYELVHQQIQALLKAYIAGNQVHLLIIGCGTGYELGYLLQQFPEWKFTAIDISDTMLDKAKQYVQQFDGNNRVNFILGDMSQLDTDQNFDAALSILVTHFISYTEKSKFLKQIYETLKPGGMFITFDLVKIVSLQEKLSLKYICENNGLSEKQTETMLQRLEGDFFALSEQETFQLLKQTGFSQVKRFTQLLCYEGFIAQR
ncbi:class I SAM-dependent methyltransferase [Acinetobacter radioresistens]|uniref:class I SAM-dependent methyltransferase n=1 Tax=Acinetobacter radioresistens TaxID=40216 RepID=UPI000C331219|nr:class I SAM-dependent methyltransferase [Acinetobacter radioresistens]PKH27892.1 SAM-dependent methyltransferase [Acinetobacter radioresistens]